MPPRDHVQFLAASPNRVALLRTLAERSRRPGELADTGSFSRSTVHRSLDAFADRGWVRKADGRYALTSVGRRVLTSYESLLDTVDVVHDNRAFFEHFDAPGPDVPVDAVSSGTVVAASTDDPHAPLSHYTDALTSIRSDSLYGVAPIVRDVINDATERFVEAGVDIELVVDESVLATSQSKYREEFADAKRRDNLAMYVAPEPLSFGLSIFDDRVFVGAYDDDGQLRALLDGTSDPLREWAIGRYRDLREDATPLGGD